MMDKNTLLAYVNSPAFLEPLGLPAGSRLSLQLLGQGEYNVNYVFQLPSTGQKLVLRLNCGSQLHLKDQIGYEFWALRALEPSGRTPKALFYDEQRQLLVMEWLPGEALRYERDLEVAAQILADIHSCPVPADQRLLAPDCPALAIYEECCQMAEQYFSWEQADPQVSRLLHSLFRELEALPLKSRSSGPRCMVNTELNSGNFLINPGNHSFLVDWEKPLLSEPAQDLGHFLAPTTTFWKTDSILSPAQIRDFCGHYLHALNGRLAVEDLDRRLPLFFTLTCLRGVSWCAMALREYSQPGRSLQNGDTLAKLRIYCSPAFLEQILDTYVRRDFLGGL